MKLSKALKAFAERAKESDTYWIERAKLDFAQRLEEQRIRAGMTYAAIAEKLGTSAAYVSKVFRGDANLTIESMVKLARSTDSEVSIQIVNEKFDAQRWANTISAQAKSVPVQAIRTPTVVRIDKYHQNDDAPLAA